MAENEPDVIGITETWTNEAISDDFLKIGGYELIARDDQKDTSAGRGGGILVYVKEEINCWRDAEEDDDEFNQKVSIRIRLRGNEELSIHVLYRSPNSSRANDEALSNKAD